MGKSLFATGKVKKYETNWKLVDAYEMSEDDKQVLEPMAKVVPSTYGKSFCFFGKGGGFKQFIPVDDRSAVVLNSMYSTNDIIIEELEKSGNTIYRCCLKSDAFKDDADNVAVVAGK